MTPEKREVLKEEICAMAQGNPGAMSLLAHVRGEADAESLLTFISAQKEWQGAGLWNFFRGYCQSNYPQFCQVIRSRMFFEKAAPSSPPWDTPSH